MISDSEKLNRQYNPNSVLTMPRLPGVPPPLGYGLERLRLSQKLVTQCLLLVAD